MEIPFQPYYQDESCTIYNADAKQVVPFLNRFDLLLTDPPYGIGESSKNHRSRDKLASGKEYEKSDWDDAPPVGWFIEQAKDLSKTQILWGGNYFGLGATSCWLVWDKDNGASDFADCELAWTNMRKAVRKFQYRWAGILQERQGADREVRVHPTQKPLPLMKWCIGLVPEAKTILDPFMGSGTTLVAAKQEGRKAIGIEINESYCESAAKRLSQGVLDLSAC